MVFTFSQKQHVLEKFSSWVMIQKPQANLNARFFKLEYLTDKLRFEVEFLDVTRGP